jgi:anti-sigma regulatory factor (Ser/Thr protein kinase)
MPDTISLTVPYARSYQGVVRLVLAGLGSRSGLSVEALEDMELALDALFSDATYAAAEHVTLEVGVEDDELAIAIGPFDRDRLEAGFGDGSQGTVGLARLLGATTSDYDLEGRDGGVWVRMRKQASGDGA